MSTRELALAVHLFGAILWIGGAVAASTVAAFAADREAGRMTAYEGARRVLSWWATPGMVLAWAGGLTMLIPHFTTDYASAGWMHGKLTLLLALSGITGVLSARLRKAVSGTKDLTSRLMNGLGLGLVVLALVVLTVVILKPGS